MRQPGEPSVEQILESIKQVMARENRAADLRGAAPPTLDEGGDGKDGDGDGDREDVLDLAQGNYAAGADAAPAPLLTEDATRSMRGSLDALAGAVESRPQREAPAGETGALEALLRELLRPALAEWLDRNLPAIVEKMVAAEIARITGRR